jgi:outer membrane lipoprotein-sorting protein
MIIFQEPKSVAGTRFLTMDNASGGTDQWIFLPELGKTRRISGSEGSGSFMGTDMSYDDIASADRDAGEDTHTLLREEALSGSPCYVIESRPRDASYQYSRMVSWIDKGNKVTLKIELYNKKGDLAKVMESSDIRDTQGRLTPMQTKMTTVAAGTFTTIYVEKLQYDAKLSDGIFTIKFLETGRP